MADRLPLLQSGVSQAAVRLHKGMSFVLSEIPVPWGHISVKAWGNPSDTPVLVLHGLFDNANSFDHLMPLLPKGFYFYCIDLPGHGQSSHFPPGMPLCFFNYVYLVKIVLEHLKWNKCILMAHSLGAQLILFFTSVYPERVHRCICIDGISPIVTSESDSIKRTRQYFDGIYKISQASNTRTLPSYTKEGAFNRLMNYRITHVNPEPAKSLLERALTESGNGYRFTSDERLKLHLQPLLTMNQIKHFIQNIKCPALMVIARDTYDLKDPACEQLYRERFETLFINMKNFKFVLVEGNHNVHMNYPERLAPYINEFLLKSMESSL